MLGWVLGARHAFEPDHLVAVGTLVGGGERAVRRGAALGALWGVGHTTSLLVVATVLGVLGARLPDRLAVVFEVAVALMLIGLGARAVRRGMTVGKSAKSEPAEGHSRLRVARDGRTSSLRWRPFAVGVVHGLAGSGALAALTLAALPSSTERLLYTAVFGSGSVVGMAALSGLASLPAAARRPGLLRVLPLLAGALSGGLGLVWLGQIATRALAP